MYTENISIPPDYFTWRSTVSSQLDNGHNWHEGNLQRHTEEQTGMFLRYCILMYSC